MKKLVMAVGAGAALLAGATAGQAADLPGRQYAPEPVYAAPVPVFTWTGFYAGLNGGYDWGKFTSGGTNLLGHPKGAMLGATAGYNQQFGQIVVGVEGDWDWANARSSQIVAAGPVSTSSRLSDVFTLRGRLGFAADRALIYGTAGYAGGTTKATVVDAVIPAVFSTSNWNNGFAIGGGIEYAFTNNISAKAEYLYTDLSSKTLFAAPYLTNAGAHENLLRAGVNYHF